MRRDWFLLSVAVACMLVAVGALAYGAGKTAAPAVVQAQQFELVNDEGRVVAALVAGEDEGTQLRFWDGDGKLRMRVGLRPNGDPWLLLHDKTGKLHVARLSVLGQEDDVEALLELHQGASRRVRLFAAQYASRLELLEADANCSSSLGVEKEGRATLGLSSAANQSGIVLDLSPEEGALLAFDVQQGQARTTLDAAPDGRCGLWFFGKGGSGQAGISTWPSGHSRLTLNDSKGDRRADLRVGSDGRPSLVLR